MDGGDDALSPTCDDCRDRDPHYNCRSDFDLTLDLLSRAEENCKINYIFRYLNHIPCQKKVVRNFTVSSMTVN